MLLASFAPLATSRAANGMENVLTIIPACIFVVLYLLRPRTATMEHVGDEPDHEVKESRGQLSPAQNHLRRFRILLSGKILALVGTALLLAARAALPMENISSESDVYREGAAYSIAASGMIVAAYWSYHTHQTTWPGSFILQIVLLSQFFVLALQVALQWTYTQHRDTVDLAVIVSATASTFLALALECIPRITSQKIKEQNVPPELYTNIFSFATFSFAQPIFTKAYKLYCQHTPPNVDMLWPLADDMKSLPLVEKFDKLWEAEATESGWKDRKPRFWKILLRAFGINLFFPVLMALLFSVAQFAGPVILDSLIGWLSNSGPKRISEGIHLAFALLLFRIFQTCVDASTLYLLVRSSVRIQSSLIAAIYRKSLRLSAFERGNRSFGAIVSHINTDVPAIVSDGGVYYLFIMITIIPSFVIGVYLLYQQLQWVSFVGLACVIVIIGGSQGFNSQAMSNLYGLRMEKLDKRTALVNEVISNIKVVKLSGWTARLHARILDLRDQEMHMLRRSAIIFGRFLIPTQVARNGSLVVMLVIYTMAIKVPTAANVFVSLAIFDILYKPIEQIGFALQWVLTARKSMQRVGSFLSAEEMDPDAVEVDSKLGSNSTVACIDSGVFAWSTKTSEPGEGSNKAFLLKVPSLSLRRREILAVVGKVASGKSSLLQALIGQMHVLEGSVSVSCRRVAYCPETPFIMSATLSDNIIGFDLELDESVLDKVVDACALKEDIMLLPGGLNCEIGEKGVNLSGGQRSRVGLARACYSALKGQAELILLDSVLEAVDSKTDAHLWKNVIGKTGILNGVTRVLVTHAANHLQEVHRTCCIDDGRVVQIGSHDELMKKDGLYQQLLTEFKLNSKDDKLVEEESDKTTAPAEKETSGSDSGTLIEEEMLQSGRVTAATYLSFFGYAGWFNTTCVILCFMGSRTISSASQFWLSHWVNSEDAAMGRNSSFHLGIYAFLAVTVAFAVPVVLVALCLIVIYPATAKIYRRMVESVLEAPLSWFNSTPTGRIATRLSSDLSYLDSALVGVLGSFFAISTTVIAGIVSSAIATRGLLLLTLPILIPTYCQLFIYYTATSRSLRRLESGRTRSPMISQVSESSQGAHVLSAIDARAYIASFYQKLDLNSSALLMEDVAANWLQVRVELIAASLSFAVAASIVVLRNSISDGLAGLAMTSVLNIANLLTTLLNVVARAETAAVHAERSIEYAESLPKEAAALVPSNSANTDWPKTSAVRFRNVSARYRPDLPLILHDIDLDISPGAKVAIVGRTGSGKSSLILSLFRVIEIASGAIEVGGVDTSTLGLEKLRQGISIIPQENQAFEGSVRSNLCLREDYSDEELWNALEAAQLKDAVTQLDGKLDAAVQIGGSNFSAGQLQQLGLARALLAHSKIVVLDEATSSLDLRTDSVIQSAIREHFKDATVLTIAHRIRTILDNDVVVVMKEGRVTEMGSPKDLLGNRESLFYALVDEAGELTKDVS